MCGAADSRETASSVQGHFYSFALDENSLHLKPSADRGWLLHLSACGSALHRHVTHCLDPLHRVQDGWRDGWLVVSYHTVNLFVPSKTSSFLSAADGKAEKRKKSLIQSWATFPDRNIFFFSLFLMHTHRSGRRKKTPTGL